MIRDISDICLQDALTHVHTFTSKYRAAQPPNVPLEEPVRDSRLRRPGPPSGRFPFSGLSRTSAALTNLGTRPNGNLFYGLPNPLERHRERRALNDVGGNGVTTMEQQRLRLGRNLGANDIEGRTGNKPLDLFGAEGMGGLEFVC